MALLRTWPWDSAGAAAAAGHEPHGVDMPVVKEVWYAPGID